MLIEHRNNKEYHWKSLLRTIYEPNVVASWLGITKEYASLVDTLSAKYVSADKLDRCVISVQPTMSNEFVTCTSSNHFSKRFSLRIGVQKIANRFLGLSRARCWKSPEAHGIQENMNRFRLLFRFVIQKKWLFLSTDLSLVCSHSTYPFVICNCANLWQSTWVCTTGGSQKMKQILLLS